MSNEVKVWTTPAISDDKIFPDTLPPNNPQVKMTARACRGQHVPFSVCVRSGKPLVGLMAKGTKGSDWGLGIRYVACWWQGRDRGVKKTEPTFTPELLLHDLGLFSVDMQTKTNQVRERIEDANELQPIYLEADYTQQYWVTIHVPEDAAEGTYNMYVALRCQGIEIAMLPIVVNVLPFDLLEPATDRSIYYTGRLAEVVAEPQTESIWKTEQQYRAELKDMYAHGVTTPNCYQQPDDPLFERAIEIRREVGLKVDPLYMLGGRQSSTGWCINDPLDLMTKQRDVSEIRRKLAWLGIHDAYFYAIDECPVDKLKRQKPAWEAVREAGGKIHAACNSKIIPVLGELQNLAIIRTSSASFIPQWHELGTKVWLYSNPQAVEEYPETYRRNYGLQLEADGFDGCCPFAFQHKKGATIWNDQDDVICDHAITYPAVNGVIDTIQWEGFYEGGVDLRYLATLLALGGTAPPFEGRDLYEVREETIDMILDEV